eukprot:6175077-Pleurochrysis_carterae.AAC.1
MGAEVDAAPTNHTRKIDPFQTEPTGCCRFGKSFHCKRRVGIDVACRFVESVPGVISAGFKAYSTSIYQGIRRLR